MGFGALCCAYRIFLHADAGQPTESAVMQLQLQNRAFVANVTKKAVLLNRDDEARERLLRIRMELYNYNPEDVAKSVGCSVATVYAFRSGRTIWPRPKTLFPLLEFLGYTLVFIKKDR